MSSAVEVWAAVVGYEGLYEVSSLGSVRSLAREILRSTGVTEKNNGKVISLHVAGKGYLYVGLYKNAKRVQVGVHRLVAEAFHGPSRGLHVNHIDCNKTNNAASNLEWVTRAGNAAHAKQHGRFELQTLNGQQLARVNPNRARKLCATQVDEIIRLAASSAMKKTEIAAAFGISPSVVSKIHLGKLWKRHSA